MKDSCCSGKCDCNCSKCACNDHCDVNHTACARCEPCATKPFFQAFQILRFAFTILPILAGLDKFFNVLVIWEQYLAPGFNFFGNAVTTMMVVGVIEIIVGIGVWFKPRLFSYILAIWLLLIIINLLVLGFYDIALKDFGLLLGVLALGRLSIAYCCCCKTCKCGAK